jgi:hypothetical protein
MPANKQIVNSIKKSLSKFDFTNLEERCTNEAQTRFVLIEPLLEVLGYSRIDDMATEINAGWGQKNDKADIGLIVKGKIPEIIVECKTLNKRLTDKEASQLNGYFINTKNSKFGILTNGLEWRFYFPNDATKEMKLYDKPFTIVNFEELTDADVEFLSQIHKNNIDLSELHDKAQDFFFIEGFTDALLAELLDPSDKLIEAVFSRMHGKRLNDTIKSKLRERINSGTIQSLLPRLIEEESKSGNFVITTAEELKIYHAVKTLLLNSIKKLDASRISYRDQKNSFNIIVDDNNKKIIAKITNSRNKYSIDINGERYDANNIENIVALKKPLIDITQSYFETIVK